MSAYFLLGQDFEVVTKHSVFKCHHVGIMWEHYLCEVENY